MNLFTVSTVCYYYFAAVLSLRYFRRMPRYTVKNASFSSFFLWTMEVSTVSEHSCHSDVAKNVSHKSLTNFTNISLSALWLFRPFRSNKLNWVQLTLYSQKISLDYFAFASDENEKDADVQNINVYILINIGYDLNISGYYILLISYAKNKLSSLHYCSVGLICKFSHLNSYCSQSPSIPVTESITESEFLNFYGVQESITRNRFHQPM
jgi:hypothetical protein